MSERPAERLGDPGARHVVEREARALVAGLYDTVSVQQPSSGGFLKIRPSVVNELVRPARGDLSL